MGHLGSGCVLTSTICGSLCNGNGSRGISDVDAAPLRLLENRDCEHQSQHLVKLAVCASAAPERCTLGHLGRTGEPESPLFLLVAGRSSGPRALGLSCGAGRRALSCWLWFSDH